MTDGTKIDLATLEEIIKCKLNDHKKLKAIFKYLRGAHDESSIYVPPEKLQQFNIRVSTIDLEQGGRFFKPIPVADFKSWIYDETILREIKWDRESRLMRDAESIYRKCWNLIKSEIPEHAQTEDLVLFLQYTPWSEVIVPRTRMGGNFGISFSDELTNWVAQTDLHVYECNPSKSHVISFSTHGLQPDKSTESKLTRSEILVLMISCFNRQARVNEVYFEDGTLHFNCTPFIDMEVFDKYKCELLARWSVSHPVGETTAYPNLTKLPDGFEKFMSYRNGKPLAKSKKKSPQPTPKPTLKRLEELKKR
ncbi:uncharacterized protein MCYG_00529 [Microsporum canis CBS 113480]|uniref:Uncharacterized protein n=1 Tax=Arthroderma otae (strain ATCC MYA-4605 / CBS 113480) TaxID=554155 RepID=C5FCV7_ARTOC|nr:uncharacterized protein MCYG_00529 [Microsporum canis CBS 113480]EEQ27641.1 predicted protein [Microsporum canis CBS 113480]